MGYKIIAAFLDSVPDEKLCNWSDSNHTTFVDRVRGFRLDHQGLNQNKTHRVYIHPIAGGKSAESKNLSPKAVLAQIHVEEPGNPQNVRDALKESAKKLGVLVKAKV